MPNLIENEINQFVMTTTPFPVESKDDLNRATLCIKGLKQLADKVKESYDPIIDKAHKAHKESIAQRDRYLKPILDVERKFKDLILVYTKQVEAAQRELERKTNEELAKIAEANKKKFLDESKAAGNEWESEVLKEKADAVVPVTVDVPKRVIEQEGLSIRKTWKARIIDPLLVPREYLIINMAMLNADAKDFKDTRKVPGVEFYIEESASVRV